MSELAKVILSFVVSIFVGAYRAFALMLMWNWFVSPVFHTDHILFWEVLGLLWLVELFVGNRTGDNPAKTARWESLFLILDSCVPEHKREELQEDLKQKNEEIWSKLGLHLIGQLAGTTITVALGWTVHTFLI
jgi:hypothetical protein